MDTKVGSVLYHNACRDAIHIAIAPVIAGEKLNPGQHVKLNELEEAIIMIMMELV